MIYRKRRHIIRKMATSHNITSGQATLQGSAIQHSAFQHIVHNTISINVDTSIELSAEQRETITTKMNKFGAAIVKRLARSSAAATAKKLAPNSIHTKFIDRKYSYASKNDDDSHNHDAPSSSSNSTADRKRGRRVWSAIQDTDDEWINILNSKNDSIAYLTADGTSSAVQIKHWQNAVDDGEDRRLVNESLSRICEQVRIYNFVSSV